MMKYRKKPVVVEARRFEVWRGQAEAVALAAWCGGSIPSVIAIHPVIEITTREGLMTASDGDYIIKEPHPTDDRRFYPCKPDIFEATYEEMEDQSELKALR